MRLGTMMNFPRWMATCLMAALGVTAAVVLTGCGEFFTPVNNNPGGPTTSSYVYVANITTGGAGGTISEYSLASGVLTALSGSPITLPAVPTSMIVSPNNVSVYVGTATGVFLYTIGSDGTLTEGNNNTVLYLGPTQPKALAMDSTSSWLIISNQNSAELDALPVTPSTGLPTGSAVVTASLSSASPQQVAITSPTSNVSTVFVALAAGGTEAISFDAANTVPWAKTATVLKLASGSTAANAVAVDPTSTYAYVAESAAPSSVVRVITIKTLAQDGSSYPVGNNPQAVLPDTSAAYVYVANSTDNNLTGFSQSAGALTALADSPFETAKTPFAMVEDSSKTYVLTLGSGNNPDLWVYTFDAASLGTLDVASTISTGSDDPSGGVALAITH